MNFAMLSLMPPTYKGRANGMRIDLAEVRSTPMHDATNSLRFHLQALAAMKPGIFRFPGGNNLEGETIDTRWKWKNTIGPLVNRPGRMGDWSYINTE